jgi:hypothetical protein
MGFGPMWRSAKFSNSRLIVSGLSVSVTPDAHLNRRMSMTPSKQSDIKPSGVFSVPVGSAGKRDFGARQPNRRSP